MTEKKSLIWDETFPALILKGEGSSAFLHGQTTADIFSQTKSERIFRSCWLSTKGNLKALLEIRISINMAEIAIISGQLNSVINGFESVIFPADKVNLEVIKPIRRLQKISKYNSWKESNPSWQDGNNLLLKKTYDYNKLTNEELEIWKIRQGIPSFEREINGETNPYELGLGDTVKLDKGCYLGQEAIARLFRSKSLRYKLHYWESSGDDYNFDIGKKFFNTNKDEGFKQKVGVITSSIRNNDDFFTGLALIKNNSLEKDICFSENGVPIIIKKPISFSQPY